MDRWEGKVAVVTGASGGIGSAIVEKLVNSGISVVGLDRRLEKLEQLSASLTKAKGKLYTKECDVRNEQHLLNAFNWINVEFGGVDILVNNAGVLKYSTIIDDNVESFRKILEVNVLATAISIREAIASMKSRDVAGYIININSLSGHRLPDMPLSVYPSSKFAITALTETVRKELATEANNKIKITSISPGIVKTKIFHVGGVPGADDIYETKPFLDPKDIADAVVYVLGTRPKVQVTELTIRPIGAMPSD